MIKFIELYLCFDRKDVYVFDLRAKRYWCLSEAAKNGCCFEFGTGNPLSILIGTKYGTIYTVGLGKTN